MSLAEHARYRDVPLGSDDRIPDDQRVIVEFWVEPGDLAKGVTPEKLLRNLNRSPGERTHVTREGAFILARQRLLRRHSDGSPVYFDSLDKEPKEKAPARGGRRAAPKVDA